MRIDNIGGHELLPPPAWASEYLSKLVAACGYEGKIEIAALPHVHWPSMVGMTTAPDAFIRVSRHGAMIVIPDNAQAGPPTETAIAHEMVHAMRMPADWFVFDALQDADQFEGYVAAVEQIMDPFAIMLYAMTVIGATFVRETTP